MTITLIVSLLLSYLIGATPFGLLFSKAVGKDVRQEGSGNIGATNVNRILGKKLGVLTLLCDVAKGFFPVFIAYSFLPPTIKAELIVAFCGLSTVLGHMFSVYLGFKGGKGVATALGVFLFFSPLVILCALVLFVTVVYFSGFVSAGSLAAAAFIPVGLWVSGSTTPVVLVAFTIALLIWRKHGSNISRLKRGEETSWKKKEAS